jgi:hypothetical protein
MRNLKRNESHTVFWGAVFGIPWGQIAQPFVYVQMNTRLFRQIISIDVMRICKAHFDSTMTPFAMEKREAELTR